MAALARLVAVVVSALAAAAAAPALAQQAGGGDPAAHLGGWLWIWAVAAIAVLAALFVTIFRRDRTRPPSPPARTP